MEVPGSTTAEPQRDWRLPENHVDFLNIEHCRTTRLDKVDTIILAQASYLAQNPNADCPHCGGVEFQRSTRPDPALPMWDVPRERCPVLILLTRWPMACSKCGRAQDELITWYHPTRKMTSGLDKYIRMRCATLTTFDQIAVDACQESETVAQVFSAAFEELDSHRRMDLPRVLGIDEIYFHGRAYTVLVDIETNKAIDLLDGRNAECVQERFKKASNPNAVEFVTQDFSTSFRAASAQPPAAEQKKNKKSKIKTKKATLSQNPGSLQFALFTEDPFSQSEDMSELERSVRISREELKAMLPNAQIVGDHFHFKHAILAEGFNSVRLHVAKHLKRDYYPKVLRRFEREQVQLQLRGMRLTEAKLKKKANDAVKARAKELDRSRYLLFERASDLDPEQLRVVKKLLADHPMLRRAWLIKEAGLNIFPTQQALGRTRKSRDAEMSRRERMRLSEAEAGRRLDAWVGLFGSERSKHLLPFFTRSLNLIKNWRPELIRIATTGYSNAASESKNRFLRTMASICRGLEFDMLRARLLWADEHRSTSRWPSFCDGYEGRIDLDTFVDLALDYVEEQAKTEQA